MSENYTITFDPEKKQYYVALSAHDKLWIVPPPWFSMQWRPEYVYRGEQLKLSDKQEQPTQLELSTEEVIQLCQQSWKPFADVLPTLMINGVTTAMQNKLKWFDRIVAYLPLLLLLPAGVHGAFCGCIALGLNLAVLKSTWPGWQKTVSMLVTTSAAAMIYFSGLLTIAVVDEMNADANHSSPEMHEVIQAPKVSSSTSSGKQLPNQPRQNQSHRLVDVKGH